MLASPGLKRWARILHSPSALPKILLGTWTTTATMMSCIPATSPFDHSSKILGRNRLTSKTLELIASVNLKPPCTFQNLATTALIPITAALSETLRAPSIVVPRMPPPTMLRQYLGPDSRGKVLFLTDPLYRNCKADSMALVKMRRGPVWNKQRTKPDNVGVAHRMRIQSRIGASLATQFRQRMSLRLEEW